MRIAVLVPAHNEAVVIEATLGALMEAGRNPADIYVVDDASTDDTPRIVARCGVNLLALTKNGGKSAALNAAIAHFSICDRYDYVAFLDADTEVDLQYFAVLEDAALRQPEVSLFLGQVRSKVGTYITALRTFEYTIGHDLYKMGQSKQGTVFVAPGCASLYRSDVLRCLTYTSDTLAEDMDLTMQVQRLRKKIVYVQEAMVYTQDPATLKGYIKQVLRWQRGGWQVVKKHHVLLLGNWQKVDVMLCLMLLDALLINRWTILPPLLFFATQKMLIACGVFEAGFFVTMALYAWIKSGRADVFYKLPTYFWVFYILQLTYIWSFVEVFVLRRSVMHWTRVQRY